MQLRGGSAYIAKVGPFLVGGCTFTIFPVLPHLEDIIDCPSDLLRSTTGILSGKQSNEIPSPMALLFFFENLQDRIPKENKIIQMLLQNGDNDRSIHFVVIVNDYI